MLGHILKKVHENKCVCFSEINGLIIMKMKIIIKNVPTRYLSVVSNTCAKQAHSQIWDKFWQLKTFKNDENDYFTLKAFFILKIFKFLS